MSKADVRTRIDEVRGKLPPEVEQRLNQAATTFRENHRHPANLALHAVGYLAIAKGVLRILSGRPFRGLTLIAMGVAALLAGHEIEGTEAFAVLKSSKD
jgi:hypothetical protein